MNPAMNARICFTVLFACSLLAAARARAMEHISVPRELPTEIEDVGEIQEAPQIPGLGGSKFHVSVSTRAEYTSNSALSGSRSSSDVIFFPTIEANYTTGLGHGFGFNLDAAIESGLFASHDDRSFIGYDLEATVDWKVNPNAPRVFIGAEPYRYDSYDRGGLITEAIGAVAGVDWGRKFQNGRSFFFAGYAFENYFSDPSIDNRGAHRAVVGVSHQLSTKLLAEVYYQFQYTDYHDVGRCDARNAACFSLLYQLDRHAYVVLSEAYVDNNSSQADASYQAANSSLSFYWQF